MSAEKTIIHHFLDFAQTNKNRTFLHQPFGDKWETYTYGQVEEMARKVANYILGQGIKPGSHIGLVSKNCREWIIADLGIMMAGCVSVPFFATLTGEQINLVLRLGDVDMLIAGKLEVWDDMGQGVPDDMPLIKFPHYEGNSKIERGKAWEEIMAETEPLQDLNLPKSLDDMWTIVFTSGTTGTPKGVVHTYRTLNALVAETMASENPLELSDKGDNRFFSFLPLNHIAERAIVELMSLRFGGDIYFSQDLAHFAQNLRDAKPTVFFAVPRIWTKFMLGILAKTPQKKLDTFLKLPILKGMVKKKVITGLGLENSRCNVSGAAPIAQSTKDWFKRVGVLIDEGYGMTESFAACSFLKATDDKPGSVGKPAGGMQVKIDPDNQEILMKAGYIMKGYYKDPEKTAETITDGWLHTGDQGKLDEDGYLFITGRVKDTFKTEKGKFIVPAEIEKYFDDNTDIEQMCLLGLGMPQPVMTVVLSEIGQGKSKEDLKASLEATVKAVNSKLPSYKKLGAMVIVKEAFSVENNTMTPSLKVKRPQVHNLYKDKLLNYCEDKEIVIWE
ncbi:MAG: AMP-binding protein [Bacteroidota bacterium]